MIVAPISHRTNSSVHQTDTMTENHHWSKHREQGIVGVKSQVMHLHRNCFTEDSWNIPEDEAEGLILRARDQEISCETVSSS